MAAVTAKNGLIIMNPGDEYTSIANKEIVAIQPASAPTVGSLTNNSGDDLWASTTADAFYPHGAINTGRGLANQTDTTLLVYVR